MTAYRVLASLTDHSMLHEVPVEEAASIFEIHCCDHSTVARLLVCRLETHWWKAERGLKLGEGAVMNLEGTQAEALCPAIKIPHQLDMLGNAKPDHRHLAARELVQLRHMVLQNLRAQCKT